MEEKLLPNYPVYVISKGRHDCCFTADFLLEDKVPFHVVVEPQEAELYIAKYGIERVYVLPFSNLGLGSIPARNWCWEHSKAKGFERHWIFDDNIRCIYRRYKAKRIPCEAGIALHTCEEFINRYSNIGIAGLNYSFFAPDKQSLPPFYLNTHVYSCLCIQNDLPQRWRGRYNEDTDLCLQVLASGLCTVSFNAFLINKMKTMTMKGGNMETLYQGDGRLKMAKSLERVWPYVVSVNRRFKRPQHVIRDAWAKFDTPLKLKDGLTYEELAKKKIPIKVNKLSEIKSDAINSIYQEALKDDT